MNEQWCALRGEMVSDGVCNSCNRYYLMFGVRPFLSCIGGHCFRPEQAICEGSIVRCPICRKTVAKEEPSDGMFCCDYIDCMRTCDWYQDPNRCNLARDPKDARRMYAVHEPFPIRDHVSGRLKNLRADAYQVAVQQVENQEALNVTEAELQEVGKSLSEALTKVKFLHRGNVDTICGEIQDSYNRILQAKYRHAKVVVLFEMGAGKPKINISAKNSVTAWLLHRLAPHVRI